MIVPPEPKEMPLPVAPTTDTLKRPMTDLRISVTDRCNFRCAFCMPAEHKYTFLPRREILSFEEVARLAGVLVGLGVRKVRLTGGEPLLRAEIESLIRDLAEIPGLEDLALTTNGYLLGEKAQALAEAGLRRVTVSFHSLKPEVFGRLNGLGLSLDRVLSGLGAARRAGLGPIKLNVVPVKGINDDEIVPLARWAREQGYTVRYIEYMDVGTVNAWNEGEVLSAAEILERIDREMPLEPLSKNHPGEVAHRYRYRDGGGEIGVIPSVTQPFCGDCSRVRLSAEGRLFTCLFSAIGHDLKVPIRQGDSDEELAARIAGIWRRRADRYSEERTAALKAGTFRPSEKIEMFRIGG
ncbi:MAG: GTP 3',8-cyclase MoaA [Acidobacteria bacterium]|nr:GTP 3',8-cyclase MoaA [Acidobacteriota bacterium]